MFSHNSFWGGEGGYPTLREIFPFTYSPHPVFAKGENLVVIFRQTKNPPSPPFPSVTQRSVREIRIAFLFLNVKN